MCRCATAHTNERPSGLIQKVRDTAGSDLVINYYNRDYRFSHPTLVVLECKTS
jgi:hypothetical protein